MGILKKKIDELGNITRNKARLVSQGYTQVEGINYDEMFVRVARLESIQLLLLSTNVEYSWMVSSEGHTNEGSEDELIAVKTLKGKNRKRVREFARFRELSESSKKTRLTKRELG